MHGIPPLTVAVPLALAALIAAVGGFVPRPAVVATAVAGGTATAVLQFVALLGSWPHGLDHWFGGWLPQHGFPVGIVFTVDPLDGSLACVVGVLMVAALVFSAATLHDVSHLYYAMMLAFLGGMSGFAVSGDLFNMFVFYELMSVAGYALCSFRHTSSTVIQGALNFAIVNSIGAFFILMGIALVYARTGALNLAEIAVKLHGQHPDGLLIVSFVFVMVGFLTKAGAVPFHFWMSDAYAVAAAPVGCMYAGIMSDLGYHAVARIYSSAYAGSLGSAEASVRGMLVGLGVATVLVGGVMCFLQADIKRQMAFLVIGHGGIFLCGIGLLNPAGLAGSTMYVAADGMLKGAAFLVIGYIVVSLGASDELLLRGRGRSRRHVPAGIGLAACGVGLAAVPGIGPWLSASLLLKGASAAGYGWLPPVLGAGTVLTAAAILRSAGRVFLGWGPGHDPILTFDEPDEPEEGEPEEEEKEPTSPFVLLPAAVLLVAGYGMAFAPQLAGYAEVAASRALDLHGYVSEVIAGHRPAAPAHLPSYSPGGGAWVYGAITVAAAVALAGAGLTWTRLPRAAHLLVTRTVVPLSRGLKAVHSGRVGDMATWLALGAVALCAAGAAAFR